MSQLERRHLHQLVQLVCDASLLSLTQLVANWL